MRIHKNNHMITADKLLGSKLCDEHLSGGVKALEVLLLL